MKIFTSFIFVGLICLIASLIYDKTKLSPGHITSLFVSIGAILGMFGVYDILLKNFGYGLTLPITSFGNSLFKGAYEGFKIDGILGLFMGVYEKVSGGLSMTIVGSFLISLICKPKD